MHFSATLLAVQPMIAQRLDKSLATGSACRFALPVSCRLLALHILDMGA